MAKGRLNLTPAEAAALQQAFRTLQSGDPNAAARVAQHVLRAAPESPDALHLLALSQREIGDTAGARTSFERALKNAPRHVDLLSNYGALLHRLGLSQEAAVKLRAAVSIEPRRTEAWLNLALALQALGDKTAALDAARKAHELAPNAPRTLHMLATTLRDSGDLEGAENALRQALAIEPDNGWAWTALGIVRRLIGDPEDSLLCYEKARALGYDTPELSDAEASAHLDLGHFEQALEAARKLTETAPAYVAGHVLVAHILWEYGVGNINDPLGELHAAAAAQPQNIPLRAALVNSLLEAERSEEALEHALELRRIKDEPALATAHSVALLQLGRVDEATAVLERAAPTMASSVGFSIAFARQLIRVKRPDEAARFAEYAASREPLNQEAWSLLSVAWRMLEDPREHWLCDYDRFVMTHDVAPPPGYADQAAFIAALSDRLTALHTAQHAPLNQSLRGGTQTSGSLFGRRDPIIAATRDALKSSIEQMIARLPEDSKHPFLSRRSRTIRFTGSWSVRLRSAGRHVNHYHPKGWLSSAFYIQLPSSVADDHSRSGWIQFGQPPLQYETGLEPRRFERPVVGRLVLFPSYMWHGTVPFSDDAHRMTVAFDAIPA